MKLHANAALSLNQRRRMVRRLSVRAGRWRRPPRRPKSASGPARSGLCATAPRARPGCSTAPRISSGSMVGNQSSVKGWPTSTNAHCGSGRLFGDHRHAAGSTRAEVAVVGEHDVRVQTDVLVDTDVLLAVDTFQPKPIGKNDGSDTPWPPPSDAARSSSVHPLTACS